MATTLTGRDRISGKHLFLSSLLVKILFLYPIDFGRLLASCMKRLDPLRRIGHFKQSGSSMALSQKRHISMPCACRVVHGSIHSHNGSLEYWQYIVQQCSSPSCSEVGGVQRARIIERWSQQVHFFVD